MSGKSEKKDDAVDCVKQANTTDALGADRSIATDAESNVAADSVIRNELESKRRSNESFVVKSQHPNAPIDLIRSVNVEQLYTDYPMLTDVKGLEKIKSPLLFISEQAERDIKGHISWNKTTHDNVNEQGGILIGRPFRIGKSILGIVERAIPADVSRASSAYLVMGTDTWSKMLDIYDDEYKDSGLLIIGWFHTHPNSLSVFMSGTDMNTQRGFFNQDWHFSVVLNPHRRLMACFNSGNADKCEFYPPDFVDR